MGVIGGIIITTSSLKYYCMRMCFELSSQLRELLADHREEEDLLEVHMLESIACLLW